MKIYQLIKQGQEQKAFRKLYGSSRKAVLTLQKLGANKQQAEDAFQEAMLFFAQKCQDENFILTSTSEAYVIGVAKKIWANEARKSSKTFAQEEIVLIQDTENIIEQLEEKERRFETMELVLNQLGDKCKEVLTYFYVKQWKMDQIAKVLGYSSTKTVKTRKYKCLEQAKSLTLKKSMSHAK